MSRTKYEMLNRSNIISSIIFFYAYFIYLIRIGMISPKNQIEKCISISSRHKWNESLYNVNNKKRKTKKFLI